MYRRSDLDAELLQLADVLGGDASRWPTGRRESQRLVELAEVHRVDGVLDEMVRARLLCVANDQAVHLAGASLRAQNRQTVMDRDLLDLLDLIDESSLGAEAMVLKGWWTSQHCYEQRSERRYSDLDIWISPHSRSSVGSVAAYLQKGSGPSAAAYDALLDGHLLHNAGIRFRSGLVELHKNPYGLKVNPRGAACLWDSHSRAVSFFGRDVLVPSPELALLTACVNYTRDCFPQLYQLLDVHRLSLMEDLDWVNFWDLCAEQGLERFAHGALALSALVFQRDQIEGLNQPKGWSAWWTGTARALQINSQASARAPALLLAPQGVRNVAKIAARWMFPPTAYWEILGATYRRNKDHGYVRNVVSLHRVRVREASARYRKP